MDVIKDKCELLDRYNVGDEITAEINIQGRPWTDPKGEEVYFTSINAWKITNEMTQETPTTKEPEWMNKSTEGGDKKDLPF